MKVTKLENNKNGTYGAVSFNDNDIDKLIAFAEQYNVPNILDSKNFHATLAYSRKFLADIKPQECNSIANPKIFKIWESPPNANKAEKTYCLILLLDCQYLIDRFNNIMFNYNATYDYDEYNPHVTISYNVGEDFDVNELNDNINYVNSLQISEEYFEDLDLNKTF